MLKIKNIALTVIALVFVFNSFGFIFYFLIERENVRKEATEEIENLKSHKRIEVISISTKDLEKGIIIQRISKKEFRYHGRMYDLVKEERHSDIIIFYCIHDEKEDRLEKEFSNSLQKNFNHKSVTNTQLQFNHQIQIADEGEKVVFISPFQKTSYPIYFDCNYLFDIPKILTPPPKSNLS